MTYILDDLKFDYYDKNVTITLLFWKCHLNMENAVILVGKFTKNFLSVVENVERLCNSGTMKKFALSVE